MSQPDTLPPLTCRQARIVEFIRDSHTRRGYPPSIREIGEAVHLVSPSSVTYQLKEIARKGYIRRDPEVARGLVLLDPAVQSEVAS